MFSAFILALVSLAMSSGSQGERVPDTGVANGVPQGIFVARSLLSGRAVCLLFLGGGRITRAIPEGGLEDFDWNRHRAAHGADSGTWQMRGGQLVVTWGDGGVHQGPLTVHPDGIEFYGKRYYKPATASLSAIAGRWEAARGGAITGGSGINRVSELVIATDGRYQWATTIGGAVEGRAVASDRSMSGQVTLKGATITFRSDAGTSTSHTFLPAAGAPVTAFSVDTDMFTRSGPAPSNSYQGLAFTLPSGWVTNTVQGRFIASPANVPAESLVIVVFFGAEKPAGSFDDWLRAKMSGDLMGMTVLQAAPPTRGKTGGLETLSAGRTVQDQRSGVVLQIYYAISDGLRAGLAMVVTSTEAALRAQMPAVQALFQSLRFGSAEPAGGSGSDSTTTPPNSPAPAPGTVSAADLVGHWDHGNSNRVAFAPAAGDSTKAYGQGYTFDRDGTYHYEFVGTIDRAFLRESDSGTWGFEGGNLVTRSRQRNSVKAYRIIQFQSAPDGSATMILLLASYPVTDSNVNVWGERYVRKGK